MRKTKLQKGITLVALVITIIVLIILAAVAIGAIQNKGIIKYAQNASADYEVAEKEEQSVLASLLDKIKEKAPGNSGEGNKENEGNGNEGSVTIAEIDASNYGDSVEYSAGGVTDWKIFYNEGDYVYIIAADYLPYSLIPNDATDTTKLNMSNKGTDYPYSAYWSSTNNFRSESASAITPEVANKYKLSWLANNSSSIASNARATADLLKVDAWTSAFGNDSKGIEAIGSPTLEMWVASWNAKGEKYGTDKYVDLYVNLDSVGYYYLENINGAYNIGKNTEGYNDVLYFPHQSTYGNCSGYLLASPHSQNAVNSGTWLAYVADKGDLSGYDFNHIYASMLGSVSATVRPLVSLPSELLIKTADGSLKVNV